MLASKFFQPTTKVLSSPVVQKYILLTANKIINTHQAENFCVTDARNIGRYLVGSFRRAPLTLSKEKPKSYEAFITLISGRVVQMTAKGITRQNSKYSETSQHAINILGSYKQDGEVMLITLDRDDTFKKQPVTDQIKVVAAKDLYSSSVAYTLEVEDVPVDSSGNTTKTIEEDYLTYYEEFRSLLGSDY